MKKFLAIALSLAMTLAGFTPAFAQNMYSRGGSLFQAFRYSLQGGAQGQTVGGPYAVGAVSIQLASANWVLVDGRVISPYNVNAPLTFGTGANAETLTPSAVSGCASGANSGACSVTVTTANTHGSGEPVYSGTSGLQEAINDAFQNGGGQVGIDSAWRGTNANIVAAVPYWNVSIADRRSGLAYWKPVGGLTTLAAPATLLATTAIPSAAPVGAYTTGTYHILIAYVDALGQEGPSSADFSEAGLSTGSFVFTAPAASAGAVGYTIYIGLTGGAAGTVYKVPLVTQPTVVGVYPAAGAVCTLTAIETITPACALTNATYGQVGVGATVTALTLNTSPIAPQITTVSTTSIYPPNAGGRTTQVYTPGSQVGIAGTISAALPFTISAADATVVPSVIGTINIQPGFMNYLGRAIEICGYATTTASAATIENIQFQWDAMGQNTAGKGVLIGDLTVTKTATSVMQITFCEDFQTTVTSASATGGSIQNSGGYMTTSIASLSAAAAGGNTIAGATGSLNLAADARINVIYLHTTATDGTAVTLQSLTVKALN